MQLPEPGNTFTEEEGKAGTAGGLLSPTMHSNLVPIDAFGPADRQEIMRRLLRQEAILRHIEAVAFPAISLQGTQGGGGGFLMPSPMGRSFGPSEGTGASHGGAGNNGGGVALLGPPSAGGGDSLSQSRFLVGDGDGFQAGSGTGASGAGARGRGSGTGGGGGGGGWNLSRSRKASNGVTSGEDVSLGVVGTGRGGGGGGGGGGSSRLGAAG